MNFGIILLTLMLLAGSILGIIMIGSQNQTVYEDTFGDVQGNQTNDTLSMVTNTTAPLMDAGAGLVLVIAVFLIAVAAIALGATVGKSQYGGRR